MRVSAARSAGSASIPGSCSRPRRRSPRTATPSARPCNRSGQRREHNRQQELRGRIDHRRTEAAIPGRREPPPQAAHFLRRLRHHAARSARAAGSSCSVSRTCSTQARAVGGASCAQAPTLRSLCRRAPSTCPHPCSSAIETNRPASESQSIGVMVLSLAPQYGMSTSFRMISVPITCSTSAPMIIWTPSGSLISIFMCCGRARTSSARQRRRHRRRESSR